MWWDATGIRSKVLEGSKVLGQTIRKSGRYWSRDEQLELDLVAELGDTTTCSARASGRRLKPVLLPVLLSELLPAIDSPVSGKYTSNRYLTPASPTYQVTSIPSRLLASGTHVSIVRPLATAWVRRPNDGPHLSCLSNWGHTYLTSGDRIDEKPGSRLQL